MVCRSDGWNREVGKMKSNTMRVNGKEEELEEYNKLEEIE